MCLSFMEKTKWTFWPTQYTMYQCGSTQVKCINESPHIRDVSSI